MPIQRLLTAIQRRIFPNAERTLHQWQQRAGDCGTGNAENRHQWIRDRLAELPAGQRLLDAGAGEQQFKDACAHLDYVSQDFAQYDGSGDNVGLQTGTWNNDGLDIVSDITSIPEPDASFDAVMCTEVFEHIPHPQAALIELTRLLKPGGTMILTAPAMCMTHFAPYFFSAGYSRYFYEHWADQLGLEIVRMDWNGTYFHYIAQELRRIPDFAQRFTETTVTTEQMTQIYQVTALLNDLSKQDTTSHETLAYGIHTVLKKKTTPA